MGPDTVLSMSQWTHNSKYVAPRIVGLAVRDE